MYIADLHIHSHFSRATSREGDLPHLDFWARRKGIRVVGTGDFTHPAWRAQLREQLVEAEPGLYALREGLGLPEAPAGETPRFLVTGEISCIYKRHGKTRKVHNLILLPSLEAAEELSAKLEAIGNIRSDGRPILGLDSRDLLELTLDTCPEAEFIPAHIWTPHFALFGAFSGFDSMEACFGDLTPHIHAVETGLSSDPPMNWRLSALDGLTLVSHSDAHSPMKLGREADVLDTGLSYGELVGAIRTGEGFSGTIEFFPEEGKYHLDGHRNCGVCLTPAETAELGGRCPVCGKKLTIGVEHRVEELSDRPAGFRPEGAKPFERLAPLPEVIAASTATSPTGKGTMACYERLLRELGPEFPILREIPIEDISRAAGPCVAEGIRRLRLGQVERRAGFDGEYGAISLLTPGEIQRLQGQMSLFGAEPPRKKTAKKDLKKGSAAQGEEPPSDPARHALNGQQRAAVAAEEPVVAVVAGPGTGKTGTLVERIAWLVEERGVKPGEITAVTFTNQAAAEMRQRLEGRLGGKRAVAAMTIGTFHAICLALLGDVRLISPGEALTAAEEVLRSAGSKMRGRPFLQAVSRVKNGFSLEDAGLDGALLDAYQSRLRAMGALDFDDLLTAALRLDTTGQRRFAHLLVDEFQDINTAQYGLVCAWSRGGKSLFVIGDPDQSIYGFRGAGGDCFRRLVADHPQARVIRLVENYRSAPAILEAALSVIAHSGGERRLLVPTRPAGPPVRLAEAEEDFSQAVWIAKEIRRMAGGVDMLEAQRLGNTGEGRPFSDIAVLCRTHRQLNLIESCLGHDDIPCLISGREEFLDDPGVRGALAFFRSLLHPGDLPALETALSLLWNCPADLIQIAQTALAGAGGWDFPALWDAGRGYGHLEQWLGQAQTWLPRINAEKPFQLLEQWAAEYGPSPALEKLRHMAVCYPDLDALWNALSLGEEADLRRSAGKRWASGAVRLMTLHGAKGLEFPVVFLAGLTAGTLPLSSQGRPADTAEERRLFYVGLTRAREELILTTSGAPSPFLSELPDTVRRVSLPPLRERGAEQLRLF